MKEERSSRAKSVMNEEVNGRRGRGRPGPDKRSEGVKRAVKDRAHRKKREAGRQLARKRKDKNRKKERASREPARFFPPHFFPCSGFDRPASLALTVHSLRPRHFSWALIFFFPSFVAAASCPLFISFSFRSAAPHSIFFSSFGPFTL